MALNCRSGLSSIDLGNTPIQGPDRFRRPFRFSRINIPRKPEVPLSTGLSSAQKHPKFCILDTFIGPRRGSKVAKSYSILQRSRTMSSAAIKHGAPGV